MSIRLSPVSINQYRIGRIYQLIKPINHHDLNNYGLKVGDYIIVMGVNVEYDRYSKTFRNYATKIVQLEDHVYNPILDTVLAEWTVDFFMEVDMSYLPTDIHNAYTFAMKVTPEWMLMCV